MQTLSARAEILPGLVIVIGGLSLPEDSATASPLPDSLAVKPPTDLSGTWNGTYDAGGDDGPVTLTLVQTGDAGTCSGTATPS